MTVLPLPAALEAPSRSRLGTAAAGPTVSPFRRTPPRLFLVCLLLLTSAVAWRKGTLYGGGVDPVVAAKAVLGLLALVLAATAPRAGQEWARLRVGPLPWLALYLAITCAGASLVGEGPATVVLAARVALLSATVVLLFRSYPAVSVLSAVTGAMLVLAGVSVLTGAGSLTETGRLYGGLPPLNANEIALLVGLPVACLLWCWAQHRATWPEAAAIAPLLGVVWLTGARTGLVALALAVVVVVVSSPRIPVPLAVLGLLALPVALAVTFLTPLVATYATRGDPSSTLTLNSRTVAWEAALHHAEDLPARLFGVGLSVKEIPVSAMYRSEQLLDSTWVSAIVQAGWLGTGVLVVLVVLTLVRAVSVRSRHRTLLVAVLLLLVVRSVLESGLFDASAAFLAFLCFSLAAQPEEST